jgi:hypothetical protein
VRRVETKEIDGISITTEQLRPTRAYRLAWRLVKVLGPVLGQFIPAAAADGASMRDVVGAARKAGPALLGAAFAEIDDDAIAGALTSELLSLTTATLDGKRYELAREDARDTVFDGRLPALFRAVWFALEVNFADFFVDASSSGGSPEPTETDSEGDRSGSPMKTARSGRSIGSSRRAG